MFGATVLIPFIVGGAMGMPQEQLALLISTIFFASGICTLIQQSPLGNRLPVIQGGTFSFLGPTFAIVGHGGRQECSGDTPLWQLQIQEVAGAIMIASVVEIVLGYTGIMGQVRKIISPIVIGPTIAMIGLALFGIGAPWMATNWIISLITLIALILYSQVFSHQIPDVHALSGSSGHRHRLAGGPARHRHRLIPDGNAANLAGKLGLVGVGPLGQLSCPWCPLSGDSPI